MTIEINTAGSTITAFGPITADAAKEATGLAFTAIEDGVKAQAKNRKAAREAMSALNKAFNETKTEAPASNYSRRYTELLEVAEREGLSHGRAWICGEFDIQVKGAHPSWEGLPICYVYENYA